MLTMKTAFLVGLTCLALPACSNRGQTSTATTSSASSASAAPSSATTTGAASPAASAVNLHGIALGIPAPADKVVAILDPKGDEPYSGPTGTLRGVVRISGDPSPETGVTFPPKCKESVATYGKLFRVGLDKVLADAMVAVTGYGDRGFVPERQEAAKLTIHGCATNKRTMAVTFGQRIEVSNLDSVTSYMPFLDGAIAKAVMVAVPGGEAVKLYPMEPGAAHYMIRDELDSKLVADVFVVKFPTHDVTGLDGKYEIKGIPVGKVRVDAFLPVLSKSMGKEIEIKAGDNTLDLDMTFDAKTDLAKAGVTPAPAGSTAPAPSAVRKASPAK